MKKASIVSIVIPCFDEEKNVSPLLELLQAVDIGPSHMEVVFVDDGSSDTTWGEIKRCVESHASVRGIRLSRNFGHQCALIAGLGVARGDAVVSIDADRQHPVSMIPQMVRLWKEGAEIVTTTRSDRAKPWRVKQILSRGFYKAFGLLTDLDLLPGQADFRLMDRQVVDLIVAMGDRKPFLRGIVAWVGFRRQNLSYLPEERQSGFTKYSLRKMLGLARSGIMSFSQLSLRIVPLFGCAVALLSFAYCVWVVSGEGISSRNGVPVLAALISFFGGLGLLQLSLMGEYLLVLFIDSKRRPTYIVAEECENRPLASSRKYDASVVDGDCGNG